MVCKDGLRAHRRVTDSTGDCAYLMWIEDCFDPTVYFVRGENLSDAYAWFLCDPRVERAMAVDAADIAAEFDTPAKQEAALNDGVVEYNDNGTLVWGSGSVVTGVRTVREPHWHQ